MRLLAGLLVAAAPLTAGPEPAVTVTAPGYSAQIQRTQVGHWARTVDKRAKQRRETGALAFLIEAKWLEGEARERGITVTAKQTRDSLDEQIEQSFATRAQYRRYRERHRLTVADVRALVRKDLLQHAIEEQITQPAAQSVTNEQIDAYVQANPRVVPEERDVRVILTKTQTQAQRARAELESGRRWRTVARRYSIDQPSRDRAGRTRVSRGTLPNAADKAVFGARTNRLTGPVYTQFGFFVFKVTKITPEHPAPIEEQRATAWEILAAQAQNRAMTAFKQAFRAKWRSRTTCAGRYAGHADCGP